MLFCPVHGASAQPYSARRLRRVRKPRNLILFQPRSRGFRNGLSRTIGKPRERGDTSLATYVEQRGLTPGYPRRGSARLSLAGQQANRGLTPPARLRVVGQQLLEQHNVLARDAIQTVPLDNPLAGGGGQSIP